jgi:hypothetical protein
MIVQQFPLAPKRVRGKPDESARRVKSADVPAVKGMLIRGDLQSDIAAFFGTNSGRVCEINTGKRFSEIEPASPDKLPPPGPYMAARSAHHATEVLKVMRDLAGDAITQIEMWEEPDEPDAQGDDDEEDG